MTRTAQRLAAVRPSASMAASLAAEALRAQGFDVIDLGLGEPDFPTPRHIAELCLTGEPIDAKRAAEIGLVNHVAPAGELDAKTKELIALAIGVAARCDGCIGFHTQALIKLGVTKLQLAEMLGVAVMMGGGPSLMYAAEAMRAYEEFGGQ